MSQYIWKCFLLFLLLETVQFSSVQSLSCAWFFETPWIAARQASLSLTISQRLPKIMFIETVMPSNYLIICHPLLLLPSIFPSFRAFSNESALCIRWPKGWSFSFSLSSSNEYLFIVVIKYWLYSLCFAVYPGHLFNIYYCVFLNPLPLPCPSSFPSPHW